MNVKMTLCAITGKKVRYITNSFFVILAQKLDLNLNFERGFGSWVHSNDTTTKWAIHNGSTQTPETGPTIDHTFANKTGKYMYFESSHPRIKGDDALLISPIILLPTVCVHMYYHMLGKRMGEMIDRFFE